MVPRILLFALLFLTLNAQAQREDYRIPLISHPASPRVKSQTLKTTQGCNTEFEKVYAIHEWITHNIAYSYAYGGDNYKGPEQVISARKAVCAGYADLFAAMCLEAGVQAWVVIGYGKNGTEDINPQSRETNHAWNMVKIDGHNYLVDACWDAGSYDKATGQFTFAPGTEYFLANPSQFILNHFPEQPENQLLDVKVTAEEFFSRPVVYSKMLEAGYRIVNQMPGMLQSGGVTELHLLSEARVKIAIQFDDGSLLTDDSDVLEVTTSGQYSTVTITVPEYCKKVATLFVQQPGEMMYHGLMVFGVE